MVMIIPDSGIIQDISSWSRTGETTLLDPRFKKIPFTSNTNIITVEDRLVEMMNSSDIT